jgi:1-acyl-sn-glycerol-3-phosphate acyltransferase
MLATRSGAPILPVGISGTDRFLGRGQRFPRLGAPITVRVGKPLSIELDPAKARRAALEEATDEIMRAIAAQLEPRHRGRYGGNEPL